MTIQELYFIQKIKKAQIRQDRRVIIDRDKKQFRTCADDNKPIRTVKMRYGWNALDFALEHMGENDRLHYWATHDLVQLTFKGFHYKQIAVSDFFAFLAKSIVVPIVVSILTTLVVLWIKIKTGVEITP